MTREKQLYLFEQAAQKAWTLSLNFTQAAGYAGNSGRGYAVVASEVQNFANKMFDYCTKVKFETADEDMLKGIFDLTLQLGYVAVNAVLEVVRTEWFFEKTNNKGVMVLADEIRQLALSINELGNAKLWQKPFVVPEILSPIKSSSKTEEFLRFSIGGIPLVENCLQVEEIFYYPKAELQGNMLEIRGTKMPIINCYSKLNLAYIPGYKPDYQAVLVINPDYESIQIGGLSAPINVIAVPIDDLDINTIFTSRIGYDATPKEDHALAPHSRECWDAVSGGQLMFLDWRELI